MSLHDGGQVEDQAATETPPVGSDRAAARVAQLELIVSYVLRWGVLLSFLIVLVGAILLFAEGGRSAQVRLSGAPNPQNPGTIFVQALQLQPRAIIDVGLMLLIATPIIRVAVSVVGFLLEEDFVYTAATLFVLAMLLLSLVLGRAEG